VDIPPRTATDHYLSRMGQRLDIVFDVDLGELTEGHQERRVLGCASFATPAAHRAGHG
jgi:hypothetical protein